MLCHGQSGFSLIETLVGVAIFAAIGVTLMSGLATGFKSLAISQERTYAESLARSQVEHIRSQDYISVGNYPTSGPYEVVDIPTHLIGAGYTIEVSTPVLVEAAGVSGYELQGITITIKRDGNAELTITIYTTGLAL